MTGAAQMALYFTAGVLLGALYLGGLWLTVTRLGRTARPGLLLAASTLLRLALLLGALAALSGLQWQPLAACLAGFIAARITVTVWLRTQPARRDGVS